MSKRKTIELDSEGERHAASLKRLKYKDPAFHKFLKENDSNLLNFGSDNKAVTDAQNQSDLDEVGNEETIYDQIQNDGDQEESSFSDSTIPLLKLANIKLHIREEPTLQMCKDLISAFKICVHQAEGTSTVIEMSNSEHFNEIINLCLDHLVPALFKVMKLSKPNRGKKPIDPTRSKSWVKLQVSIKSYLINILKMFSIMTDTSALIAFLRHTISLLPFYCVCLKLRRHLVKKMITFWCSEEKSVRVLSFLIILNSMDSLSEEYHGQVLKEMYFAYIKNTKFTSPTTLPMINFMKSSLATVYAIYPDMAYQHAFIYLRQMGIHLRNARTTKKRESFQVVYNWQYIHCILFWSHLLCRLYEHESLKPLIHPLVEIIEGTMELVPTAKYVPLRFHLIKALIHISKSTGIYIPVLKSLLEVLKLTDFNKKSNFSVKPVDFSCALKVTKSQLAEAGFKDSCIVEVSNLAVDYLTFYSSSVSFPELALSVVMEFRGFIKQCKVSKYSQQLKFILQKVEENSLFIAEKRKMVSFAISDIDQVKEWEKDLCDQGTPLLQLKKPKKHQILNELE